MFREGSNRSSAPIRPQQTVRDQVGLLDVGRKPAAHATRDVLDQRRVGQDELVPRPLVAFAPCRGARYSARSCCLVGSTIMKTALYARGGPGDRPCAGGPPRHARTPAWSERGMTQHLLDRPEGRRPLRAGGWRTNGAAYEATSLSVLPPEPGSEPSDVARPTTTRGGPSGSRTRGHRRRPSPTGAAPRLDSVPARPARPPRPVSPAPFALCPSTRTSRDPRLRSRSRRSSTSWHRNPLEYINSNSALSRTSSGLSAPIASSRSAAWTGVSTCGRRRGTRGDPTPAAGLVSIRPFSSQKPRKPLTTESLRAIVLRA